MLSRPDARARVTEPIFLGQRSERSGVTHSLVAVKASGNRCWCRSRDSNSNGLAARGVQVRQVSVRGRTFLTVPSVERGEVGTDRPQSCVPAGEAGSQVTEAA